MTARADKKDRSEGTLDKTLSEIAGGKTHPCYLLYGDEDYLIEGALKKMVDLLLPERDREFNLFVVEGDPLEARDLYSDILTPPLLPGRKVFVFKNTRLFYSRSTAPELIKRAVDNLDTRPPVAASSFMAFLSMVGWSLEDLRDGGWAKISDEDWEKALGDDVDADREKWVPRIVELCLAHSSSGGGTADMAGAMEEILSGGMPDGHVLIFTADVVDKRKRVFKAVADRGVVMPFAKARGEAQQKRKFVDNIDAFLSRRGKKLSPGAWEALGRKTGFQFRESAEAMDLLVTYCADRTLIEEKDVEEVIDKTREGTVFELISAILGKDLNRALANLRDLFRQGVHHLMILTMVSREIRLLLHAKIILASGRLRSFRPGMDYGQFSAQAYPRLKEMAAEVGAEGLFLANQHPFVIYNALRNSGKFSQARLLRHVDQLVAADVAMKSTGKDPRLMLERLVIDLCR
ncbi:MAG TPA: DNA polymerase III subunit delta [Syntrophales bacterium]|nr:DNA polymerase III subunit delta [Syntrophales bacterium]HOX95122.1 DNA polymerase III subunit delta [Syntrophales bacterium]HPI57670.1 DNA polymerase III subunit delta [Syntrophales bacterium]HPN23903.1 DNA polymerase III subunit delta [Syntrophales bacterium]HQM28181.1 DNA polymerase III subunit delta [Syntrophales bacterium]